MIMIFYEENRVLLATFLVFVLSMVWWCNYRQKKQQKSSNEENIPSSPIYGPKAALSSAIATALDEFFVVDAQSIKSNLLRDAKIVLRDLQLRPQTTKLPNAVATVTGSVELVTFSWAWGMSIDDRGWVKDSKLSVKGLHISALLAHQDKLQETPNDGDTIYSDDAAIEPATSAAGHGEEEAKKKRGGIVYAYIQKQVQMIIDSLTLNVDGVELTMQLPQDKNKRMLSVEIGARNFELVSLGRLLHEREEVSDKQPGILRQPVSIVSFYANVQIDDTTYPLIDPFSYSVETTRSGERFGGWLTNLDVVGRSDNDLVVHAKSVQICALTSLGVLVMAPPPTLDDANNHKTNKQPPPQAEESPGRYDVSPQDGDPSTFAFDLSSMSLILDKGKLTVPNVSLRYRADGTIMSLQAQRFRLYHGDAAISVTGIHSTMVSPASLRLDSINELYVPGFIKVTKPITNVRIVREGTLVSVDLESIEATMLSAKDESTEQVKTIATDTPVQESPSSSYAVVPCPVRLSLNNVQLKNSTDGSLTQLRHFRLYLNPVQSATQVAMELDQFCNTLLLLNKVHCFGSLPVDTADEIDEFQFAAESGRVTAGHSVSEWSAAFKPAAQQQATQKPVLWKLPYARVGPLKLVISWKTTGMSLKDTKINIEPFAGNADNTLEGMIHYYAQVCLKRAPDFIPNAEVLGLNVVDSTVSTWGGLIGMAGMGPFGGVAAIAAVDGVKKAIVAGKKSRQADEGESTRVTDFFRGIVYSVDEFSKDGASILGRDAEQEDALDLVVGTAAHTGKYVYKNKARLAGAGIGGLGMVAGAVLAGPVGAIVVGVATQAIAAKAIEKAEDLLEKKPSSSGDSD